MHQIFNVLFPKVISWEPLCLLVKVSNPGYGIMQMAWTRCDFYYQLMMSDLIINNSRFTTNFKNENIFIEKLGYLIES